MKILVISHSAPFDKAGSAGEKTHNYYLKAFNNEVDFNVRLISFCPDKDSSKLDLETYGIENKICIESYKKINLLKRKVKRAVGLITKPNDKYANFISQKRRKFLLETLYDWKKNGYFPDCIILEWTHIILLVDDIKKIYPEIPVVASSHDVSYMGALRRYEYETNKLIKIFRRRQYQNLKKREITSLSKCDLIVPQNQNDINILQGINQLQKSKFLRIVPYYDNYSYIVRKPKSNMIVFFGNMGRPENYLSVKWFIENVFNNIETNYHFVIIGGNPPEFIKKYESDRIHVTGFIPVKEIDQYFSICTCMVVPLKLGSGIKVKVLEAFSAGIPVLTNHIGNEGISAEDKKQYLHCETAMDFITTLNSIYAGDIKTEEIGNNGRLYLNSQFNLDKSRAAYVSELRCIGNNNISISV